MKRITLYLHGSKEHAFDAGEAAGLTADQLDKFRFAGYEHAAVYEVDDDGWATLVEIDGRAVERVSQ